LMNCTFHHGHETESVTPNCDSSQLRLGSENEFTKN